MTSWKNNNPDAPCGPPLLGTSLMPLGFRQDAWTHTLGRNLWAFWEILIRDWSHRDRVQTFLGGGIKNDLRVHLFGMWHNDLSAGCLLEDTTVWNLKSNIMNHFKKNSKKISKIWLPKKTALSSLMILNNLPSKSPALRKHRNRNKNPQNGGSPKLVTFSSLFCRNKIEYFRHIGNMNKKVTGHRSVFRNNLGNFLS